LVQISRHIAVLKSIQNCTTSTGNQAHRSRALITVVQTVQGHTGRTGKHTVFEKSWHSFQGGVWHGFRDKYSVFIAGNDCCKLRNFCEFIIKYLSLVLVFPSGFFQGHCPEILVSFYVFVFLFSASVSVNDSMCFHL
jgi:hypothetical protein